MTGGSGSVAHVDLFEAERPRLRGLAYRMLGSIADADDVVQDAWLRWDAAAREAIRNPAAWLTTVTTRLALDRLRARQRDQRRYVGPWLPEPLVAVTSDPNDPAAAAELADSLTFGFLTLLEVLTPAERAAFLLVDVFGEPSKTVADTLDRSEDACRQLASRARAKLRSRRTTADGASDGPPARDRDAPRAVVDRFVAALATGDESAALACLGPDVDLVSDGGPARRAARHPILGRDRVCRFLLGLGRRLDPDWTVRPATVGGLEGLVVANESGIELIAAFDVVDGRVGGIRLVMNPDKLGGVDDLHQIT